MNNTAYCQCASEAIGKYHTPTDEIVQTCSDCSSILGVCDMRQLPNHFFVHIPHLERNESIKVSSDILDGDLLEPQSSRFVHICGSCGHWLSATPTLRDEDNREYETFQQRLNHSFCPNCGEKNMAYTSVVAPKTTANNLMLEDIQRFICNWADKLFWAGGWDEQVFKETQQVLEEELKSFEWSARCPACGYAVCYDGCEFDFHHWDYENDIGCCLCRRCHKYIHRDMRASDQADETGREWQYDAVKRLHWLSQQHQIPTTQQDFIERYNIPQDSIAHSATVESVTDKRGR
jgi:hypothetical protein